MTSDIALVLILMFLEIPASFMLGYYWGRAWERAKRHKFDNKRKEETNEQ